jgi:hypothetical protein
MGVFNTVRSQAEKILGADPYFASVSILKSNDMDWLTKAKTQLAQVKGLCILIHSVELDSSSDSQGPQGDLSLRVAVIENVAINRLKHGTRISADDAAEYAAWLLHTPNHARVDTYLCNVQSVRQVSNPSYLVYEIAIKTSGVLTGEHTEEEV